MKEEALLVYTTLNYKYKSPRKIPQKKRKERRKKKEMIRKKKNKRKMRIKIAHVLTKFVTPQVLVTS